MRLKSNFNFSQGSASDFSQQVITFIEVSNSTKNNL